MSLFASRAVRELEGIIREIEINLSNNYKEPAHNARKKLGERTEALFAAGKLSEKAYRRFHTEYERYTEMMKDYRH